MENVEVLVRLAPVAAGSTSSWTRSPEGTLVGNRNGQDLSYQFDRVYSSNDTNGFIFQNSVANLVKSSVDGYNVTIAAYGQSGSGKTHSVIGSRTDRGIIYHIFDEIFNITNSRPTCQFMVTLQVLEIYNEKVFDLLSNDDTALELFDKGSEVVVKNATYCQIRSSIEAMTEVEKTIKRRHESETKLNAQSSRSHIVFKLVIEAHEEGNEARTLSRLIVADLAGSENAKSAGTAGVAAKEGAMINKSLLALSNIVSLLADKQELDNFHYRNTKLTRILKEALGGNSRLLMICCIRPDASQETASTVQFARKAKNVTNQAVKNIDVNATDGRLQSVLKEMEELKERLNQMEKTKDNKVVKRLRLLDELFVQNRQPQQTTTKARRHSIATTSSSHGPYFVTDQPKSKRSRGLSSAIVEESEGEDYGFGDETGFKPTNHLEMLMERRSTSPKSSLSSVSSGRPSTSSGFSLESRKRSEPFVNTHTQVPPQIQEEAENATLKAKFQQLESQLKCLQQQMETKDAQLEKAHQMLEELKKANENNSVVSERRLNELQVAKDAQLEERTKSMNEKLEDAERRMMELQHSTTIQLEEAEHRLIHLQKAMESQQGEAEKRLVELQHALTARLDENTSKDDQLVEAERRLEDVENLMQNRLEDDGRRLDELQQSMNVRLREAEERLVQLQKSKDAELREAEERLVQLQKSKDADLREAEEQLVQLQQSKDAELREAEERLVQLQKSKDAELRESEERLVQLQKSKDAELREAEERLVQLQKSKDDVLHEAEQQFVKLLSYKDAELEEAGKRVDQLQQESCQKSEEVAQLVRELQGERSSASASESLEKEMSAMRKSEEEAAIQRARHDEEQKERIEKYEEQVALLNEQLAQARAQSRQFKMEFDIKSEEIKKNGDVGELLKTLKLTQAQLAQSEQKCAVLKSDYSLQMIKYKDAEAAREDIKCRLLSMREDMMDVSAQLRDKTSHLETTKQLYKAAEKLTQEKTRLNELMSTELTQLHAEKTQLTQKLESLEAIADKEKMDQMVEELKKTKEELKVATLKRNVAEKQCMLMLKANSDKQTPSSVPDNWLSEKAKLVEDFENVKAKNEQLEQRIAEYSKERENGYAYVRKLKKEREELREQLKARSPLQEI